MAVIDFFSPDVAHRIPIDRFVTKCMRFIANQELTREPYGVQSAVEADALRAFIAALDGMVLISLNGTTRECGSCAKSSALMA
jgi:hypothetical protein